jgi:hypothetical protein
VPGLKKILFVTFTRAALMAAALVPMQAWGQSAGSQNQQQLRDQDFDSDRDREDRELDGLRGVLDQDREGEGRRTDRNVRQGRPGPDGLRDTSLPDADTTRTQDARRQPAGTLTRNISQSNRQPLDQDGVDTTKLDENTVEDPYAALGVRVGSFLLFPELSAETVYSDNLFLSSVSPEGDWALELTPSLEIRSDWSRHSLIGTLSGVRSYHDRFPTENDETFSAGIAGQLDIRRTTNLVAEADYIELLEDRSSNDLPTDTLDRPKIRDRNISLEGNHTINRVTLTLRGEIAKEKFGESTLIDGTIENNDDRNFTERRFTGRAAYELRPGVAAFIEASTNERNFEEEVNRNGRLNGSSGYDVQGGMSFELTNTLIGEASAGYAIQKPDDVLIEDFDGLILNSGLEWRVTGLTSMRFNASSRIGDSIDGDSTGSFVREAALSVEHRPHRHILLGASLGYEIETYAGSSQEDEEWVVGLTGEYIFTRSVALTVGYEHLKSTSSVPGSDYTVDEVRMGVRVRR